MKTRAGRPAYAALMAALLCLAACGGESDETTPQQQQPEKRKPGFEEVARQAGVDFFMRFLASEQGEAFKFNLYDHGSGVNVVDYDGDGLDDLYFCNQLGPNGLYRNNGDGTFTEKSAEAGIGVPDRISSAAAFADYDNDGDQDLFVATTRGGNLFFVNDGKGHFEDRTAAAGLELVAHSQGASFFDYDGDSDLDLYVTNTAEWTLNDLEPEGRYYLGPTELWRLIASKIEYNILYRNEGDGTFVDVTEETGVAGHGWGGDVAAWDADGDGDQDLFVTNMFGSSQFYRNEDGKRFTDITKPTMGRTSWGAVCCKLLDFDGDGRLDIFLADMHSDMWMRPNMRHRMQEDRKFDGPEGPMAEWGFIPKEMLKEYREGLLLHPEDAVNTIFGNTLFRNLGNGRYEEVSDKAGVETLWPWSLAVADYDQDGFEDVYIASGMGFPWFRWRNALLMNNGDGTFAKRSADEGTDPRPGGPYLERSIGGFPTSKSSRSAAVLDYDGDGRPDIVVNNFNERAYLYRNRFPRKHWVAVRLTGTRSNRDAIGSTVRIHVGDRVLVRLVCGAGGYLSQDSLNLYFGLGDHEQIDRCEVIWPNGARQEVADLEIDRLNRVVEPDKD